MTIVMLAAASRCALSTDVAIGLTTHNAVIPPTTGENDAESDISSSEGVGNLFGALFEEGEARDATADSAAGMAPQRSVHLLQLPYFWRYAWTCVSMRGLLSTGVKTLRRNTRACPRRVSPFEHLTFGRLCPERNCIRNG